MLMSDIGKQDRPGFENLEEISIRIREDLTEKINSINKIVNELESVEKKADAIKDQTDKNHEERFLTLVEGLKFTPEAFKKVLDGLSEMARDQSDPLSTEQTIEWLKFTIVSAFNWQLNNMINNEKAPEVDIWKEAVKILELFKHELKEFESLLSVSEDWNEHKEKFVEVVERLNELRQETDDKVRGFAESHSATHHEQHPVVPIRYAPFKVAWFLVNDAQPHNLNEEKDKCMMISGWSDAVPGKIPMVLPRTIGEKKAKEVVAKFNFIALAVVRVGNDGKPSGSPRTTTAPIALSFRFKPAKPERKKTQEATAHLKHEWKHDLDASPDWVLDGDKEVFVRIKQDMMKEWKIFDEKSLNPNTPVAEALRVLNQCIAYRENPNKESRERFRSALGGKYKDMESVFDMLEDTIAR